MRKVLLFCEGLCCASESCYINDSIVPFLTELEIEAVIASDSDRIGYELTSTPSIVFLKNNKIVSKVHGKYDLNNIKERLMNLQWLTV